jgi:hypothetical protein
MKTIAIIVLITGLVLRYFIKRRKFQRRTYNGAEVFKSYEAAWFTTLIEKFGFLLGTLMAIAGLIVLVVMW